MLVYTTIAKKVVEFDSIIVLNLSDILILVCTPTCPPHHVSASQEWPCLYSRGERDSHYGVCRWCTDYIAPEFSSLVIVMAMKRGCSSKAVQWQTMRRWVYRSRAFVVSSDRFSQLTFQFLNEIWGCIFQAFSTFMNRLWMICEECCFRLTTHVLWVKWVMSQWDSQSI